MRDSSSRVFKSAVRIIDVTADDRPLGIRVSFRVPGPLKYHPYWLDDPASPLALASAVRFFFSELSRSPS
jgi:hypothetical protein